MWEMNGWWEGDQSWRVSCALTLHPALVSAVLPLSATACVLPRWPGSPGEAPPRPLAPTPLCKRAASWGLLCLHPHGRVPRMSHSDSNQHRHTTALFISYVAAICRCQCKKKQAVFPLPSLQFAIPLAMWTGLIYITGWSFLGAGITFSNTVSLSEVAPLKGHSPALR